MEVRSEQGIMSNREPFGVSSMQKNPLQTQPPMQSMRLAYAPDGSAIYKPVATSPPTPSYGGGGGSGGGGGGGSAASGGGGGGGNGTSPHGLSPHGLTINMGDPVKRKRGRPRKYGPDGTMAVGLVPAGASSPGAQQGGGGPAAGGFSHSSGGMAAPQSAKAAQSPDGVKKRGRPPGSSKKMQMAALGSGGIGFTPHVITVKAGEDVSAKILSFSQHGPRAVCILSANGAISNVTLRQAATSGGTVTYEGRFEILSLSGSFMVSEGGGHKSRTGGLSVSLAGPDGRVLGGGVAGLLTAASPVQVVVGSFITEGKKERKQHKATPDPAGKITTGGNNVGPASPISRGTLSETSGGPSSPQNQSNNTIQPGFSTMPWK